ncbi:MAG TPA: DNA primase [Verrucomicrobia bacterium]|nr:MAG: hypothetical protein A2X46_16390 [Lentisphaerae bacterium GWF2_57_35]HBA83921.1 DNA primase [Verrucomicrobiota bacterium]
MSDRERALACLSQIDPAGLSYDDWLRVGMALENAGCTASDWEQWSARDRERFHEGECFKKWKTFRGHTPPVTLGTLIEMVRLSGGQMPRDEENEWDFGDDEEGGAFGWDEPLLKKPKVKPIVDVNWVQNDELPPPAKDWAPGDLVRYLEAMFLSEDLVGYVAEAWFDERKQKWLPKKGVCDRTAAQLIEEIQECKGDLGSVLGDWNKEVGAWIRINPLDGKGVRDENVTSFRHALLEADEDELGKQLAIIRDLELPCSCIVHSGGKSIHALVRVEAKDQAEYRARVDYLYKLAAKNGLKVDSGNRNPSRLSRMPGVTRAGAPQYMISGKCGRTSWEDWVEWVEDAQDDLPNPEPLAPWILEPPPLADVLIEGLLRKGHKMLLTGPSKAGKSFDLIQLCIAIAEGLKWHEMQCAKGPVLYVNLELDRASCLHRFRDVYRAAGIEPKNVGLIDVWNLRGNSVPLDRLTPKLIRRAQKKGYLAIVIDPIYKVITGDENSAEQMAAFCNQFDRICLALGAATIYSHHHSKGDQGHKRAIDRGSGSGVFGRDPDAVLDLIELEVLKDRRHALENFVVCARLADELARRGLDLEKVDEESRHEHQAFLMAAQGAFQSIAADLADVVYEALKHAARLSGWRIEGTLREFPQLFPIKCWFNYPVHHPDPWGLLDDAKAAGEDPPWMANQKEKAEAKKERNDMEQEELEKAILEHGGAGSATVQEIAEALCVIDDTVRSRLKKNQKYGYKSGLVIEKSRRKDD